MSEKPRYYTVNITIEDQDGTLISVFRSEEPFENLEGAIEQALSTAQHAPIEFDRMDE